MSLLPPERELVDLIHQKVRAEVKAHLKNGTPIKASHYDRDGAIGDKLILYSALRAALLTFSNSNEVKNFSAQEPKIVLDSNAQYDLNNFSEVDFDTLKTRFFSVRADVKNIYDSWYCYFCHLLKVDPQKEVRENPPVPFSFNEGKEVFAEISKEKMFALSEKVKQECGITANMKVAVITVNGSFWAKRFSPQQVEHTKNQLIKKGYYPIILSDEKIGSISQMHIDHKEGSSTIFASDMNDVGAVSLLADMILTTDSMWNWFMPGVQLFRNDNKKAAIYSLFTVAGSRWHVQGTHSVISKSSINIAPDELMTESVYKRINNLWGKKKLEIAADDFNVLMTVLKLEKYVPKATSNSDVENSSKRTLLSKLRSLLGR